MMVIDNYDYSEHNGEDDYDNKDMMIIMIIMT